MEQIEKEEEDCHHKEILAVEQVEADDKQIKDDIEKVERYINEKAEERESEKKLYEEAKHEYNKKEDEYNKAKA